MVAGVMFIVAGLACGILGMFAIARICRRLARALRRRHDRRAQAARAALPEWV